MLTRAVRAVQRLHNFLGSREPLIPKPLSTLMKCNGASLSYAVEAKS